MSFVCTECGREFDLATRRWRCECDGVFELSERSRFRPEAISAKIFSLWRYRAMLPKLKEPISLGEGWTPLVPAQAYHREFLAKLEFFAPTGSFKDRGTTVLVSFLRGLGVNAVVEDSSGNAAASLSAYCARAKIRCQIFVPAQASPAKLAQIRAYGAELIPIEGPRENAARAAQQAAESSYYASHVYSPLILEGTKTLAYELWEQLGGRAPGAMLFPTGHGTLLLGAYYGFRDLFDAGLIERMPALYAVQSQACAPLFRVFRENLSELPDVSQGETIAEGIRIRRPARWRAIIRAIRETGGSVITVSDDEIIAARRELARQGLYVEPTAAVAVAGLRDLTPPPSLKGRPLPHPLPDAERGGSPPPLGEGLGERSLVIPLTGSGLKAPS
ncbi:MAG: threonine synthase [Candidatus Bipolaricaulota bacterium]|nr:threonine synthase [Candidatus Bipolaricaulota bacterium]